MPKPEVFSERKSSSMMTIGKRNFMGSTNQQGKKQVADFLRNVRAMVKNFAQLSQLRPKL